MSTCNFTQYIDSSECIGDSLVRINNNFTSLNNVVCSLVTGASPSVANIRLSFDPNTPIPTTNRTGTNASVLFVHPYKGASISLYNNLARRWEVNQITSVLPFSIQALAGEKNYDIFLHRDSNLVYRVEFVEWSNSNAGVRAPNKFFLDGIAVKSSAEPNKRYVGCLRTVGPGFSEQSIGEHKIGGANTKQFLWNAQNQVTMSVYNFDLGTYYLKAIGGGNTWSAWERVNAKTRNSNGTYSPNPASNEGRNHRFSFIAGDLTPVNIIGQVYASSYLDARYIEFPVIYTAFGINDENNPTTSQGFQMVSELRGSDITPRAHIFRTFESGYHFLQLFNIAGIRNTTDEIIMNEGHTNQTGYVGSIII